MKSCKLSGKGELRLLKRYMQPIDTSRFIVAFIFWPFINFCMTLDEEQEFQILKILIDNNVDKFSFQSLPPEIKNIIGGALQIGEIIGAAGMHVDR